MAKVKLIAGIIFRETNDASSEAEKELETVFSGIDSRTDKLKFDLSVTGNTPTGFTDYYCEEMGRNLLRYWISFREPLELEKIHLVKLKTIEIESHFSLEGKRRINIDPGYVSGSKLVLFSTKDYSHRMYIADGINAEITLIYEHGKFNTLKWTYPDYKTEMALNFFTKARERYLKEVSKAAAGL